jgi:hypothetical protein
MASTQYEDGRASGDEFAKHAIQQAEQGHYFPEDLEKLTQWANGFRGRVEFEAEFTEGDKADAAADLVFRSFWSREKIAWLEGKGDSDPKGTFWLLMTEVTREPSGAYVMGFVDGVREAFEAWRRHALENGIADLPKAMGVRHVLFGDPSEFRRRN